MLKERENINEKNQKIIK